MKMALRISLMLNLALLTGLVAVYHAESEKPKTEMSERKKTGGGTVEASGDGKREANENKRAASEKPDSSQQAAASFCWKQLYAPDYRDFVKNLRTIGCPEGTVRAIVTADVHAAYSFWAREIDQQISEYNNGSWTNRMAHFKEQEALKNQLLKMPDAEDAEIADLLGLKSAPVQITTTTPLPQRARQSQQTAPVSQPLVLQDIDLSTLNLTEEQKQAVANLRQDFMQQIGGANQDPSDPAYLARWQKAQPAADDLLKAYLGADAFADYEVLAAQKTLADQSREQQQNSP